MTRYYFIIVLTLVITGFFSSCKDKTTSQETTREETPAPEPLTQKQIDTYTQTGQTIAKATFSTLSGNLKKALKEGGVREAAKYCNLVALPLTDSLSQAYQADIRRTSLKTRNPENNPTMSEQLILKEYQKLFDNQQPLKPIVKSNEDETAQYYAPILTQKLCLSCHGTIGQELTEENYAVLKDLYPEDQAIGYADQELRGMWSIRIKKDP